jgi:hypothetical protein
VSTRTSPLPRRDDLAWALEFDEAGCLFGSSVERVERAERRFLVEPEVITSLGLPPHLSRESYRVARSRRRQRARRQHQHECGVVPGAAVSPGQACVEDARRVPRRRRDRDPRRDAGPEDVSANDRDAASRRHAPEGSRRRPRPRDLLRDLEVELARRGPDGRPRGGPRRPPAEREAREERGACRRVRVGPRADVVGDPRGLLDDDRHLAPVEAQGRARGARPAGPRLLPQRAFRASTTRSTTTPPAAGSTSSATSTSPATSCRARPCRRRRTRSTASRAWSRS